MKNIQATNTTCYKLITHLLSIMSTTTMRPVRSVPKVNYSWMDVQPDNFESDPDFTPVDDEGDDETDEYEKEHQHQPGQFDYTGMEFTEEDAPVTYHRVRWWDRENLRVVWRTIQKSVLDDGDSDYYPSDEEEDNE